MDDNTMVKEMTKTTTKKCQITETCEARRRLGNERDTAKEKLSQWHTGVKRSEKSIKPSCLNWDTLDESPHFKPSLRKHLLITSE
ncbi:hypothetical protein AVEN_163065-1 [Araneus ventricosus]|uniref:Uncharacterized protein n=1 Tax=Araneus ventricosus TaxID=182803 RepID=A0A4Y2P4K8_ARAVE|nr:hypothetical protein AVEN_163065-1 [Araneus ventricosus]